jgi:hypothetical protein
MKVEFSGFGITNMRGPALGQTVSRNHYGPYIKGSAYNNTTGFPYGQYWLDNFNTLLSDAWSLWPSIGHELQLEWNIAAETVSKSDVFGNQRSMRGFDLFCKQYVGIASTSGIPSLLPVLNVYPTPLKIVDFAFLTSSLISINIKWANNASAVPADCVLYICASPCVSAGKTRLYSNIPIVTYIDSGVLNIPYDITSEYLFYRGLLVPGKKVFVKAYSVSTISGMRSPVVTSVGIVS